MKVASFSFFPNKISYLTKADLYSHVLHTNVVPLNWFCIFPRLITRLILLQPVGHRLGCLHHVLQLVWVWCRVAL